MEISNKTVILSVIVAVVISLGGTSFVLMKLADMQDIMRITGLATDGYVQININETLLIDVDPTHNTINFGTCSPPIGGAETISSEMDPTQVNATNVDCWSSNLPAYIKIENQGNVDVNLTFTSDANGADLLGGTNPHLYYYAHNDTADPGCAGTLQSTTNEITDNTETTEYAVCSNLTKGSPSPAVQFNINITIPQDAAGGSSTEANLTFSGVSI
ncbi:MAG: hypothetical protein ACQESG_04805 [Nanobdellota archaeon]